MVSGGAPERRLDVQGLRAVAVILVVVFHAGGLLSGGFIGVDVFFVVSGFVITLLVARRFDDSVGIDLNDFYSRRIRRILPALAFVSVVALLGSIPILSAIGTQRLAASTSHATSLFSANWYLYQHADGYFAPAAEFNPFLHMWSLAVEEQFYVVFPIIVVVLWRVLRPRLGAERARRIVAGVLALAAAVSFGLSVYLTEVTSTPLLQEPLMFAFYQSPIRAWEFLVGAFLALGVERLAALPAALHRLASWVGIAMIVAASFVYTGATTFPGLTAVPPVLGTALVILGGTRTSAQFPGLSSKALVWIGDRSYSWYLWHWPLIVFTRIAISSNRLVLLIAGVAALAPALLSFNWVEERFRSGKRWQGRNALALGAACVALPYGTASFLEYGAVRGWASDQIDHLLDESALHGDEARGCDKDTHALFNDGCLWPAGGDGTVSAPDTPLVVLLGDSNAGHITEPVAAAANRLGMDFRVDTVHGCPLADLHLVEPLGASRTCHDEVAAVVDDAFSLQPDVVVLASASDRYLEEDNTVALTGGSAESVPEAKAQVWAEGLRRVIERFDAAGIPVVILHPVPRFGDWSLDACPTYRMWGDAERCGTSVPLADEIARRQLAISAEQAAMAGFQHAQGLEFTELLCDGEVCRTNRGDDWLFRDAAHLSIPGSLLLTDSFAEAIATAVG